MIIKWDSELKSKWLKALSSPWRKVCRISKACYLLGRRRRRLASRKGGRLIRESALNPITSKITPTPNSPSAPPINNVQSTNDATPNHEDLGDRQACHAMVTAELLQLAHARTVKLALELSRLDK